MWVSRPGGGPKAGATPTKSEEHVLGRGRDRTHILILLIAIALRLINLNQSFWLDETIQAIISTKPLTAINWAADFQPPFFYFFTHFWMKIGNNSEWFLRLPSVVFGVLTVYWTYYLFSRMFNKTVGIISALLLATAPFSIYYSQEFRMYSLFTMLVLFSWIFLWEKRLVFYALTIAITLYTHYFTFIVIFSQLIYVLFTRKITIYQYIKILCGALIPFLFWLPILQKQITSAQNLISVWPRWREVSSVSFLKFPGLFLAKTTVGMISPENRVFYGGAVLIVGVIFLISLYKIATRILRSKFQETMLLLCYFFIPLLVAWVSGLFIFANSPHRLLFVLPAFYGIIAVGILEIKESFATFIFSIRLRKNITGRLKFLQRVKPNGLGSLKKTNYALFILELAKRSSEKIKVGLLLILILSNIFFSLTYLFNPHYHREDWREAVLYTDQKIGAAQSSAQRALLGEGSNLPGGGQTLSLFVEPWAPIIWYSKKPTQNIGASTSLQINDNSIKQRFESDIYLYTYLFELSDPQKKVENYLLRHGYKVTEEKDFRGVGIIKAYERSL